MTDHSSSRGRIDLRELDRADPGRTDRVIAAAMSRIAADPTQFPTDALSETLNRYLRVAAVAAAMLAAVAVGTVAVTNRSGSSDAGVITRVASWAESQYVPTNGELMLEFQGYRR